MNTSSKKSIGKSSCKKVALVVMALTMSFSVNSYLSASAQAADPHRNVKHEVFSSKDDAGYKKVKSVDAVNSVAAAGAFAYDSADSPAKQWFDDLDQKIYSLEKTNQEYLILTKPLGQELERVQEWAKTAGQVSIKYKLLASRLRRLKAPAGHEDLAEYARHLADYYEDSAGVYDELLKPRPPAKTLDDLEDQLESVASRSKAISRLSSSLSLMEDSLRRKYRVHKRTQDDALYKYIFGK